MYRRRAKYLKGFEQIGLFWDFLIVLNLRVEKTGNDRAGKVLIGINGHHEDVLEKREGPLSVNTGNGDELQFGHELLGPIPSGSSSSSPLMILATLLRTSRLAFFWRTLFVLPFRIPPWGLGIINDVK